MVFIQIILDILDHDFPWTKCPHVCICRVSHDATRRQMACALLSGWVGILLPFGRNSEWSISWFIYRVIWVKQCYKPPNWEWIIPPIFCYGDDWGMVYHHFTHMTYLYSCNGFILVPKDSMVHIFFVQMGPIRGWGFAKRQNLRYSAPPNYGDFETTNIFILVALVLPDPLWLNSDSAISWKVMMFHDVCSCLVTIDPDLPWITLWLWLITVRHGFSMALSEIDGLPIRNGDFL